VVLLKEIMKLQVYILISLTVKLVYFLLGVKTERIRMDSSETVFITIFFSDSKSERIVCGYEYGIGVYR
jgi:hypothetical protein